MSLAAVTAAQQNPTVTAGPKSIYVAGVDVTYGAPIERIRITEQGPGGVSALSFTVEDPSLSVRMTIGADVLVYDNLNDRPIFRGFIQTWTTTPFAGTGRRFDVKAIGIEVVLDWAKVPSATVAAGTETGVGVQSMYAAAFGLGVPLRAFYSSSNANPNGSLATPIGQLGGVSGPALVGSTVTVANVTLREAIRAVLDASDPPSVSHGVSPVQASVTVDFWFGLRMWGTQKPTDYANLTVTDTAAGPIRAANPEATIDGAGVARGVYVVGGNVAGTVLVMDGTGIPGDIAILQDSTILDVVSATQAGLAYLQDKAGSQRGRVTLETNAIATNVRAGSSLLLTDSQIAVDAGGGGTIYQIAKTFQAGGTLETWDVTYGGLPPSMVSRLRRITRASLS